jgi:hypothetical protein
MCLNSGLPELVQANDLEIATTGDNMMPSIRKPSKQVKERKISETHKPTLLSNVEGGNWDEPSRLLWSPCC